MEKLLEKFLEITSRNVELTLENAELKRELEMRKEIFDNYTANSVTIEKLKTMFKHFGSDNIYIDDQKALYELLEGKKDGE